MHQRIRHVTAGVVVAMLLALLRFPSPAVAAEVDLGEVDITLVIQVHDIAGWLGLQNELLGTARDATKPLAVTLNAGTGGSRTITVLRPRFVTEMILGSGTRALKVGVSGKLSGSEALRGLAHFQHATLDVQAGSVENRLTVVYGLSAVTAQLAEVYITR
jgi:hypothetical protein